MTTMQRLFEYIDLPSERKEGLAGQTFKMSGKVEFKQVAMRYSPNLPLVLKNLNLKVEAGQKIAIVGRTGAGKSSLY